nr:MAG TPA: hypothetical protein [Caudoviricetes sp.]
MLALALRGLCGRFRQLCLILLDCIVKVERGNLFGGNGICGSHRNLGVGLVALIVNRGDSPQARANLNSAEGFQIQLCKGVSLDSGEQVGLLHSSSHKIPLSLAVSRKSLCFLFLLEHLYYSRFGFVCQALF